ncbi:MAG TPA: hypothetical protein P5550_04945 [Bacteroidales bacterium]|nr:hypothetical protein [Bacteroidales bacterium]
MKAVMIIFNQAHTERVDYILDSLQIKGYSSWEEVKGRGSATGEPRMGTHTWPEMNSSVLSVIEDTLVTPLLEKLSRLDQVNSEIGLRAFVWNVEQSI